jgi:hypothetical protein
MFNINNDNIKNSIYDDKLNNMQAKKNLSPEKRFRAEVIRVLRTYL